MNNTKILQRCVEELKQEKPNLQYILGMLETVIELSGQKVEPIIREIQGNTNVSGKSTTATVRTDENQEIIPPAAQIGPIGTITKI